MPYGNFYVGQEGFLYKKNNGGGARRNFSLGAICNQPTDINNKYVSGSGVSGAVSSTNYAIRRKMIRNASKCSQNNCSLNYFYLGYPLGGNANSGANIPTGSSTPSITGPSTPSITSVVSGAGEATIYFTLSTGTEPIYYTVTSSPGGLTVTGTSSPLIITGLTDGTPYTFTITASNSDGTSPSSNPSNPVTPTSVPGAPTIDSVTTRGSGQLRVFFSAPTNNGGSTITDYTYSTDGSTYTSVGIPSGVFIISGLTNGTAYSVTMKAVNSVGTSLISNSVSGTPATTPGAPTIDSLVTPGSGQLTVTFTAPTDNGGSTIIDYEYSTDGSTYTSAGTSTSPFIITGLTDGTTYSVTLKAVNSIGSGPASNSVSGTPNIILHL